jgi:hypothetical protein
MKLGPLVRVKLVEPVSDFRVRIQFSDGTQRTMSLEPYLHGPVFESIRCNPAVFRAMRVEGGTITWENGADIDPDVLYYGLEPAWMAHAASQPVLTAAMQGAALPQVRESGGVDYGLTPETDIEAS